MVMNFLSGGAAISVLAKAQGIDLWIVDAGIDGDLPFHPRLIDAKVRRGTSEMGLGNTSSAALLIHGLAGIPLDDCVGRGTGRDDPGLARKKAVLAAAG